MTRTRFWRRTLLGTAAALLASPAALACYSGLILIPTTDVTGDFIWAVDLQWQGYSSLFKTDGFVFNTEIGVGERFEIGLDFDLGQEASDRALVNAKYVFFKAKDGRLSAAFGVQSTTVDFRSSPYLVATRDWGVLRTHLGLQRTPGADRTDALAGVDRTFHGRWLLMADYTRGAGNFTSAGVGYLGERWQFVGGVQWPNGGGRPLIVVHVVFFGPLGRMGG